MSKIKVLHFIYNLSQGGAETLVKDYALLINKEIFDFRILCHDRIGSPYEKILEDAGIKIIYFSDFLPFKRVYSFSFIRRLVRKTKIIKPFIRMFVKKFQPDIIHHHLFSNEYIKFANPSRHTQIFLTVHSQPRAYWDTGKSYSKKDFAACQYLIKNHGLRLIALNEPMRLELNELFHINSTLVLNNGIDFNRYTVNESKAEIRDSLGISKACVLIGHIGRFVAVKNHSMIVDSFYELSKSLPNSHLLLVGTGELRSNTERKIDSLELTDKVTILENRTDIPRILKALDAFIFPSHFEGLGIVLIEAQKMGIPCVISSAIPEAAVVSNLVHRMPQNATSKEWAEQLQNFRVNSIIYNGIENWDMNVVIKKLEYIYQQAVSNNANTTHQ